MPDNTAESWGAALLQLAAEAEHDAGEHDTGLALHVTLTDLSQIARAYAGRLVDTTHTGKVIEPARESLPLIPELAWPTEEAPAVPLPGGVGFVDLLIGAEISPAATLPDWLADTLRDLDARLTALENRANFDTVAPAALFGLDPVPLADDDRSAWDSIDRARAALRGMVIREHRSRASIRQKVLERVTALARTPDVASDAALSAELRQHEGRAQELAEIDAIAGVKLDEIAGLDDLDLARLFDVGKGWPS